ncbi:hypothetical protein CFAM422_012250 [Trichoderma lentiforme]|uniref:Uncharacterized protein n=1 Tax=Trichoderma lentiforme TaxID=1567552 RepID=A0A9P5C6J8_9HYPO|nr:hypothetical protein CFAM422_012250 [Trichoderma lentiforme]
MSCCSHSSADTSSLSDDSWSISETELQDQDWQKEIEIVVIHGIEGRDQPSPNPERSKFLHDLLPGEIDEIRAKIIFEYDVKATFGADKTSGVDGAAVKLLETIWKRDNEYNEKGACESRNVRLAPIVMVAYDVGGFIVQEALSKARRSLKYRQIEIRTELLV